MKHVLQIALLVLCVALVGVGCKSVLTSDDAIRNESEVYTPSPYSAYSPGTPEEEIQSDLRTHLEKVVEYDPDLRIFAVVFFSETIPFTQFESVFHDYSFDASGESDVLYIAWRDRVHHAELSSELTNSESVVDKLVSEVPWDPPSDISELRVEGFIALVEAQDALRLWDNEAVPVRGIGITGTESHGIVTMWTVPRPRDPLR